MIIGDGHIPRYKKRIIIESIYINLIKYLRELTIFLFMMKPPIYKIVDKRPKRKIRYRLQIHSSPIHSFFHKIIEIPKGNKSKIVRVKELK